MLTLMDLDLRAILNLGQGFRIANATRVDLYSIYCQYRLLNSLPNTLGLNNPQTCIKFNQIFDISFLIQLSPIYTMVFLQPFYALL